MTDLIGLAIIVGGMILVVVTTVYLVVGALTA